MDMVRPVKLGTLKSKGRDGELVVVSRDNRRAVKVPDIAPTLQWALDHWDKARPKLEAVYRRLNPKKPLKKTKGVFEVDEGDFHAPLPRAYQWLDGSAFIQHIRLVRKARGAEPPAT